ncbi:MAG TPA: methylmalonyl Co-A mutase-associated GTPase MeaB [Bacteroidia bacterium]|jgi:LAO/AO transport system kinase|nr:methylmalonyl Co-A mutase-associated GTPase MeaB [Bacteroidia bacterium]
MSVEESNLQHELKQGDRKALARAITIIENELQGYEEILLNLHSEKYIPIIGITGPPGAGKSTLVNSLIGALLLKVKPGSKGIGVISVDPSSPIHQGAILGDRLRMNEHFNNEQVFIRSLATRGALGGLSAKTIEITEVMRSFGFEYILVETVGVGQSEVEIAALADVTLLVITPESGDDIQIMKSGVMEIADIFVVNKADRDGAEEFAKNLNQILPIKHEKENLKSSIVKTVATQNKGTDTLVDEIIKHLEHKAPHQQSTLWAEKAYQLILKQKMNGISKKKLKEEIEKEIKKDNRFNIYRFIKNY